MGGSASHLPLSENPHVNRQHSRHGFPHVGLRFSHCKTGFVESLTPAHTAVNISPVASCSGSFL